MSVDLATLLVGFVLLEIVAVVVVVLLLAVIQIPQASIRTAREYEWAVRRSRGRALLLRTRTQPSQKDEDSSATSALPLGEAPLVVVLEQRLMPYQLQCQV